MSQQPDTSFEIDQGFQSLKSREVSDAMGPNEMQFQSTVLKYPNTGGWNVQSAAEVSPDGRAYRTETVATTDGVENIEGGKAEYQGFNEQRSSGLHEGDDKNFIKQSMESSKTHLQEKFVSGDANSDHLEVRTSSSTQSSSSKVVQSSSTVEYDNEYAPSNRQLLKSTYRDAPPYGKQNFPDDPYLEKIQQQEYYNKQSRKQSLNSEEIQSRTFQYNEKLENKNSMQNIETHQTVENEKRYVDLDKASPEYQKHVQYLMSQPGEIISNTVEYPKPNVKMITTVKRLPDGTIVRNKRYETEEVGSSRPVRENLQTVSSTKRLHNQQISDQKTGLRTTEDRRHSRDDYIVHDTHADEITNVKISSTKKSNEKYATESTTKVMHEYDEDNYRQTSNSSPQRANYKGQSPHNDNPSYEQREPLRNYTGTPQLYDSPRDKPNTHVYDRRIPNDEGEIVIVTSEKKQNIEKQSSSQHTTQTEIVADDIINYEQYPQIRNSSPKKIVAEFSPVKGPSHKTFEIEPNVNQFHGVPTDYERHRTPNEKAPNHLIHVIENTEHTEHKTLENRRTLNEEHSLILENNNVRTPEKSAGHPPVNQRNASNFPTKELSSHEKPTTSSTHPEKTVLVPSNKQRTPDFTTQGFPSQVKPSVPSNICVDSSDRKGTLDFTTQGFPSQVNHTVPTKYAENTFVEPLNKKNVPDFSTHGFPSQVKVTSPNKRPDNTYENNPYGTKPAPTTYNKDDTHKKPLDKSTTPDFSSHGFPSQPESTSLRQPGSLKSSTGGSPPQENSVPSMGHPGNYSEAPEYFRNQESPSRTTAPYPSTFEEPLERDNKHPKSTQIKSYPTIYDEPSERNNKHPKSSQGYPSQTKPSSPYPTIYDEPSEKDNKHLKSTQDYHSQTKPSPTNYNKSSERDNTHSKSTQGYPSQTKPLSPYPSTYDEPPERNNKHLKTSQGYPSQTSIYAEPSEHNNKHLKSTQGYPSQTKPPSPIKKPVSNVVEVTQKVIKKEREVDAAHRAFASSLRSSSPIESRRDSYMDTQRHTSRSSASSNRTLKRDMRESSHDSSAPSETSRTSTNTVTKRIPSTTLQIKQTVPITNKNINSYEANRKNTKSPINRNVISPQTKRTPLGGTTLREPFKSEEPSNLPASSRKDFTNSKHKIPSDDIYQTRSHNQPLVESPQSMRNNEHRTVSNETSLTTNFDIKHDQRSIILPDTSTPEVLDDDEVVDAFWRKPNKNREKPGNQSKETTVKQIDGLSNNQRRVSEELKKPKTTLIGVKEVRNVHPNKTTLQKKPTYKEPVSSYKVRPYKVVDDISLPEKPQLKTKASTSVARKTSSSVISGRKTLVTNTKTENIYSNEYIEDSNYDNNILFDREKDTHTYKQLVAKDTKTLSKIHSKVNKKSSLDKALPHNLPFDKPNKQQNKMQESQKSPEQNRKASQIHQAQKEVQKPHVKRSGKNEKFKPDEPMDNLVSRTPSHKAHYTEPKFGINSKSTSSTRTSNIEKIDTQYEYQPIVSPKSPTRKSQSPEPGNNMGTHPSTYTPTTFESEMRHPEEQFEYESMKLRKSPAPEYESPSPEHNFRGNVFAFTTTKHISDTQQLEEHLEFERIKSRKSPIPKPEIVEPKRNFGTITPTFTTGLHKPNTEQHESQPDIQSTKSTKSPTYKSESPEPKVNFETTVSTFTTSMRASDTQQYKDQSGESPIRKPETTEHISNFRKSTSPFTTTNVEQVETQHEPMDSRKSPTHKSKSPESTIKLETTSSMITTTAHKSDTQQYEEFEHRSEFQPIKSQKSSAREPKPTETKPNFGKANSPNAKKPEARRYGKSEKSKTHKTEYTEPTDNFDTNSSTITATMHKSGTQQYEQLEDQPQFKPRESQKSLAREPETLETRPSFEKAVSPFSPSNVEQPEIQRQQKPQKSATHKNELSESTIKFGTNISTITSTTHKSDTRQHEESLKFQPKNSQKSLTHRPERSESRPNLEKTTSDLTTRKFYEEPEEWPALQPTKSCKSPTHIYESPKPEVNFETDSPTVTVIKGKPDTRKPEERHFEPTKRGDSPTRYHETVESQPSLGKPICIPTDTIYKHDKEEPSDDQSTKFPKPSARGFKCTDIQSMRYSPVFNPELSESTIHFESSDTEKILSEEELSKTKTRSENLTYRKSPSPGVSQKIDLFNKNPTSKKPSVSSKESNKPFPSSCTTDYEHITFTKNVEQSSLKKFTDEEYETPETDEDLSKSTGTKPFKADNSGKEKIPTDRYNTTKNKIPSTSNKHINLEFIKSERKSTEPELFDGARISKVPETISPTLTNYSKKGVSLRETFEERCRHTLGMKDHGTAHGTFTNQLKPIEYEVKNLEDENEDYTGNKKKIKEIIDEQTDSQKPYNAPLEKFVKPTNQTIYNETHNYNEVRNYTTTDKLSYDSEKPDHQRVYMDISSTTEPKEKVKIPKNFSTDEDTLIEDETFPDVNQVSPDQINFTLKVKKAQPSRNYDNTNAHNQLKKTPEKSEKPKQQKQSPQIFTTSKDVPSSRPSTVGKPKSKSLLDKSPTRSSQDVNGASSSETSPNRISDARKSSIISVNTEIITDHMSPKYEDIKKSSNPIVKPKRKSISTERKDSAPVPRVTRHMKDAKVSHSVSENIIKVKGKPKRGINRQSEKLPKKCFAAKTINLAVRDNTDMENVIIDIQHAKSSREVSSNKIVPTPVPADLDVGHLRYPDLIREPEDEPQRKPIEKSIPIYEEETNEYIGCHISEIYNENSTFREENVCTINNDVQTTDDECLLSVQEKVSKFTKSADEVTKSKSSSPFSREYDKNTRVPEDDQCLLTINEKVSKFQKNTTDIDDVQQNITTSKGNVPTKLRPSAPQKSPELVRSISKQMSTPQIASKFDEKDNIRKVPQFDDNDNNINVLEARHQKDILSKPSCTQNTTTILKQNQRKKHERVSSNYEDAYTEVENAQFNNLAQKLPLGRTDGASTNLENTFDNNNVEYSIISQENQQFIEHSRAHDQPITKHNRGFENEPINVTASIFSPIKKVTESTIINKTHRKSISSDDEARNISGQTKAKVVPHTSTKVVTARRNVFEKNVHTDKPKKLDPTTPTLTGRRPSYMDHTKCSLEHIRRDSLEINKSNYSRKLYREDEGQTDRITSVKFDIPQRMAKEEPLNPEDEVNIEEIYDIEILEQMLQTVISYELSRRIRAQIRRIRKESRNEIDSSLKKMYKLVDDKSDKRHGTNEIVVTTSDAEYETIIPKYGKTEVKPKPSSLSPERGYNRYNNTPDSDRFSKCPSKLQTSQNISVKKPIKFTKSTIKLSNTDSHNRKGSPDQEFDDRNTFSRNSIDRKTFTKETNVIKKQYENVSKRSNAKFKPFNSRSSSPGAASQTMTTSEFATAKHLREYCPEISRASVEYNFTQDFKSQPHESIVRDRSTSPKSKPHGHGSPNILETQIPKGIARDNVTHEKSYHTTRDERSNIQKNVHNKRNINNINERSSLKLDEKRKNANEVTPIWANRNNVLRSSTTQKSSNIETQAKEMKFSAVHKDVKNVNKATSIEQDSVISSYGIGPTDDHGIPLFGIKALRKKPMTSNVTKDITGCVIEEKYYSDNKSEPIVQRKETYYSTNPDQLKEVQGKDKIKQFTDKDTGLYVLSKTDQEASENIMKSSLSRTHHDHDNTSLIDADINQENIINKSAWRVINNPDCYDASSHMEESNQTYTENYSDVDDESFKNYHPISTSETNKEREIYSTSTRSFTNLSSSNEKRISSVSDVLQLMRNADHVIEEGDTEETHEARALLNKFIGASVIMNGAEVSLPKEFILGTTADHNNKNSLKQQEVQIIRKKKTKSGNSSSIVTRTTTCDLQDIWDEDILKQLLEQAETYEDRRKIRARLRELMAEREEDKEQQEVTTTTEKIQGKSKNGRIMTTTTKVLTRSVTGGSSNKPISPFTKFKQLETKNSQQKQQQQHTKLPKISPSQLCASTTTTTSTSTSASASASVSVSTTSTAFGNSSLVQYVDPALNTRAATVKGQLLQWCQTKTSEYENIKITNFSTSWSDGLAFCALIHHFLPNAFDYHQLTAKNRRKNFEIAFTVADEKAGITPLLDVEDMVVMKCPDWKCVFVYVQSIYQHFRNCP